MRRLSFKEVFDAKIQELNSRLSRDGTADINVIFGLYRRLQSESERRNDAVREVFKEKNFIHWLVKNGVNPEDLDQ